MENSSRKELLAAYYAATPEDQSKYRYQYSLVEIKKREEDISSLLARLPGDVLNFLEIAGELADKQEVKAYLIGGMVRDLFLGLENRDLDIVLAPGPEAPELNPDLERRKEAHPPGLGNRGQVSNPELEKRKEKGDILENYLRELADVFQAEYSYNSKFRTGNLLLPAGLNVDLAEARREFYLYSGALPEVEAAGIIEDLFRRDYTINSLALVLNRVEWGCLLDYFQGLEDLQEASLRVLHSFSFLDDPTRIVRGIRLAAKTAFSFARETSVLLQEALTGGDFSHLSLERILKEFEFLFASPVNSNLFSLLQQYPLFNLLNLEVGIREGLEEELEKLESYLAEFREKNYNREEWVLRLALFIGDAGEELKKWQVRTDYKEIFLAYESYQSLLPELAQPLAADELVEKLKPLQDEELLILLARSRNKEVEENILRYLRKLKNIGLEITGKDLLANGLEPGPVIGEILARVYRQRLKGKLSSRTEQLAYARSLVREVKGKKE